VGHVIDGTPVFQPHKLNHAAVLKLFSDREASLAGEGLRLGPLLFPFGGHLLGHRLELLFLALHLGLGNLWGEKKEKCEKKCEDFSSASHCRMLFLVSGPIRSGLFRRCDQKDGRAKRLSPRSRLSACEPAT